jgi:hypothetical protein
MTPAERARDSIGRAMDDVTEELVAAALGQGDFAPHWEGEGDGRVFVPGLKPETRVTALVKLMEWGLGRPSATAKPKEEDGPAVPQTGDELFES